MTLDLHPDCKKRLIEVITKGLSFIIADHGMFIDRKSYFIGLFQADEVVPKNGKLAKQLAEYVDEFPIMDFVSDTLTVELRDLDKYQKEPASIKLTELEGYTDPKSKLTGDERVLFNKLRQMCRSVIQEEVNLLKADSELIK